MRAPRWAASRYRRSFSAQASRRKSAAMCPRPTKTTADHQPRPPRRPRPYALLRRCLGAAIALAYAAAALLPAPGLWLRRPHPFGISGLAELSLRTPQLLLALVLFSAGLQVPLR